MDFTIGPYTVSVVFRLLSSSDDLWTGSIKWIEWAGPSGYDRAVSCCGRTGASGIPQLLEILEKTQRTPDNWWFWNRNARHDQRGESHEVLLKALRAFYPVRIK